MILCVCHNVSLHPEIVYLISNCSDAELAYKIKELKEKYGFGYTCGKCAKYLIDEYRKKE